MDFRDFVARSQQTQQTRVVADTVTCAEIPARVAKAERGANRALLFDHVVDSQARIAGNLFGSPARICQAFSVRNYSQLFRRLERAMASPVPIRRGSFPSPEHVVTTAPDLDRVLPSIKYSQGDATPYLTSAVVVVRYPSSARRHLCFVRMAVVGGNRLVINPGTPRIRQILSETVGRGEELDIAILIGPPVEIILIACATMPNDEDKLEVAQAMAGEGLLFCEGPLPFPVSTEYVLKGRVTPRYEKEGPFGEVGGVYSVKERNPVCVVDELWQRADPVFHSVSGGTSREHLELLSFGARSFLERLKREYPQILRYDLPGFGGDRLAVLVVKDGFDPEVLANRLWEIPIVRGFLFVNEDVGSRSAPDLLWAMLHRASSGDRFRFSGQRHPIYNTEKFFIDATVNDLATWENRRVGVYETAP